MPSAAFRPASQAFKRPHEFAVRKHHGPVEPFAGHRGGLVSPQIRAGRQLQKLQTPPGVRLRKVRHVFNRVAGAHRARDAQPRIQWKVECRRRLGGRPWCQRHSSQAQQGKEANEFRASCFHNFRGGWLLVTPVPTGTWHAGRRPREKSRRLVLALPVQLIAPLTGSSMRKMRKIPARLTFWCGPKPAAPVPQGRPKIAQHFSWGGPEPNESRPGRKKWFVNSAVPPGLGSARRPPPSDKSLGNSRSSLRDGADAGRTYDRAVRTGLAGCTKLSCAR